LRRVEKLPELFQDELAKAPAMSVIRSRKLWRQLTSCIVGYALVLQAILLSLSGVAAAFADHTGDGLASFELCLNSAGGDAFAAPDLPEGNPHDSMHCDDCVLAGLQHLATPPSSFILFANASLGEIRWHVADWRDAISVEYRSQRPRGPPAGGLML
jgi:hypothetical protein